MNQKETIRWITDELDHLSESDLEKVREQIQMLRNQPTDTGPSPQSPFIDEIERVKEQTRNAPGTSEERHFT